MTKDLLTSKDRRWLAALLFAGSRRPRRLLLEIPAMGPRRLHTGPQLV